MVSLPRANSGVNTDAMDRAFQAALGRFIADSPGISVFSGYRSPEKQAGLYAAALQKYGGPQAARKWVAPPGHSQHERGFASDLQYATPAASAWAHANASRYGLTFPLGNEPWHVEPVGARQGQPTAVSAKAVSAGTKDSLSAALEALGKVESGGDYKARNKYTSASGKYQFIDATWRGAAGAALSKAYPSAWMAPASVQDAVARQHAQALIAKNSGDLSLLPVSWFTGKTGATAKALVNSAMVPGHSSNISVRAYQQKWQKAFDSYSGQPVSVFGPTTIDRSYNTPTVPMGTTVAPPVAPAPPPDPRRAQTFLALGRALTSL